VHRIFFLALLLPLPASAQMAMPSAAGATSIMVGAQAIGIATRVSPAYDGRDFTEGYLTQPALMAHARFLGGRLALRATLDLEGLTLRRGELTPGAYGEGYVDRRHPHTYTHEVMATLATASAARPVAASLSAGKGFAPFGTDDPMMRPFVKFPANHHLAQILERVVAIGALRAGPVALEVGAFNGDEPVGASSVPQWERFGDSWAGRATLAPRGGRLAGLELQASHAAVTSPEYAAGGGSDQRKWSASARFERGSRSSGGRRYALAEWASTDDVVNGHRAFTFNSLLAEGAVGWRGAELALRAERTVRPEEERLADFFRAVRPHTDFSILGRTRWEVVTAHADFPLVATRAVRARPLVEVAWSRATEVERPSAFTPALFYGSDRQVSLSAGLRLELGGTHDRMGRYGAAESPPGPTQHDPHSGHH
jgi:hypothetical protein